MRKIIDGTAYDTEIAELIHQSWFDPDDQETAILYRTRHGAFFFYERYLTPGLNMREDLSACSDEKAKKWLEQYANELVEKYFGEMPEGGAAERRFTLRLPGNLARRVEAAAEALKIPTNRYITRCLERCVAEDGKPAVIV